FFFIAVFFLNFFTRNRCQAPSSSSSSLCSSVLYCGFTSRNLGSSFVVVRFSRSPDFLFFVSDRRLAKSRWRNKILLKPLICLSRNSLRVTASTPPTKNSRGIILRPTLQINSQHGPIAGSYFSHLALSVHFHT
ncbi:hypothetical protein LINPERPRIM_LOCUS2760, partial [Linum perenne]